MRGFVLSDEIQSSIIFIIFIFFQNVPRSCHRILSWIKLF